MQTVDEKNVKARTFIIYDFRHNLNSLFNLIHFVIKGLTI